MPTLKNITCNLEWSPTQTPLPEYMTSYSDGHVSTYIAVPSLPTPFSIHLTSSGYIAPGLAMFVYIDGVYQCNRNRSNLRMPSEGSKRKRTEVDFRVRQKEERRVGGRGEGDGFVGREWRFERVVITPAGPVEEGRHGAPYDGEYVGVIEVVVLRCFSAGGPPPAEVVEEEVPKFVGGLFDGATDLKPRIEPPTVTRAIFDGASDPKSRKFDEDHSSTTLRSSPDRHTGRRSKPKSKPKAEPIQIHNSNVHIYNSTARHDGSSVPSRSKHSKHHYDATIIPDDSTDSSGRTSPRAYLASYQRRPSTKKESSSNEPDSLTHVRVGAGSSYTRSPMQRADSRGWPAAPGVNANHEWNWNSLDNTTKTKEQEKDAGEVSAWDAPAADTGHTGGGAWSWNDKSKQDTSWGECNKQDSSWLSTSDDQAKANIGATNATPLPDKDPWGSSKTEAKSCIFRPKSKTSKAGSVVSVQASSTPKQGGSSDSVTAAGKSEPKPKSTWGSMLKSSLKAPNVVNKSVVPTVVEDDKSKKIPGSRSPPPEISTPDEPSPKADAAHKSPEKLTVQTSISPPPKPKVYWAMWNMHDTSMPEKIMHTNSDDETIFTAHEEPPYTVHAEIAANKNLTHQVRPTKAAPYQHKVSTPKYMDTHDDPYAVFVFKYRDKLVIEKMLGEKVVESEDEEKKRLAGLSKEEIIEELLRAKGDNTVIPVDRTPDPWAHASTSKVAGDEWGKNAQGAESWKTASNTNTARSPISKAAENGKDFGGDQGENGWDVYNNNDDGSGGNGWDHSNDNDNGGGGDDWGGGNNHAGNGDEWSNDNEENKSDEDGDNLRNDDANTGNDSWNNDNNSGGNAWASNNKGGSDHGGGWGSGERAKKDAPAGGGDKEWGAGSGW